MNFLKVFINFFSTITLGIVFVCAVNMSLSPGYDVPDSVLWQVLLSGFITSIMTSIGAFIFTAINTKTKLAVSIVIHYALMSVIMISLGVWFDWLNFDIKGIVMMLISVAVVYLIAFLLNYYIIKKEAEGINIALEKHNKRNQ